MTKVVLSPDGNDLASVSNDHAIRLWNVRTGTPLSEPLTGHTKRIHSVVFSPDGTVLTSASDDHTVRLWDARTGMPLTEPLTNHTWGANLNSIAFSLQRMSEVSASDIIRSFTIGTPPTFKC